jgi:hypothetical protein
VSPHELAKDYVLERLHEQEERELLRMALNDLFVVNQQLRGDIATTAEAILIAAGKVDEKEAREWVERTFRPLGGIDWLQLHIAPFGSTGRLWPKALRSLWARLFAWAGRTYSRGLSESVTRIYGELSSFC